MTEVMSYNCWHRGEKDRFDMKLVKDDREYSLQFVRNGVVEATATFNDEKARHDTETAGLTFAKFIMPFIALKERTLNVENPFE